MIAFELTMPNKGSWNNKWTGEGKRYIKTRSEKDVPKDKIGKRYYYSWPDGWTACVSVNKVTAQEARTLSRKSAGFCGYDWMIGSIIKHDEIRIGEAE